MPPLIYVHPAKRLASHEMPHALRATTERIKRPEAALVGGCAVLIHGARGLGLVMRGLEFPNATTMVAEAGDFSRFDYPRHGIPRLGSRETQGRRNATQGSITKAGSAGACQPLIEAAWTYRYSASRRKDYQRRQTNLLRKVRDIAWEAQVRLYAPMSSTDGKG